MPPSVRTLRFLIPLILVMGIAGCAQETAIETPADEAGATVAAPEATNPAMEATAIEPAGSTGAMETGDMLSRVRDRGELICGVNDQLPGFGFVTAEGQSSGFDVDYCHAFAAAIFGDASKVRFRPLTAQQRFTALATGEVDVLVRNTTWTLTRDTENHLDFGPTTFYDGQGVMVPKSLGIAGLDGLDGASICVQSGTTTEKNIADAMRKIGAAYTPVVFDDPDQTYGAYEQGRCDAVTSDKSQLLSRKSVLADPSAHMILDATLSKEPLGPAVLQGDPAWRDIVDWVTYGIVTADEMGINSENVGSFADSEDPEVRRFLGIEENLGEKLGLDNDFMLKVIEAVGNYQEIYDRNLGPDTPFDLPPGPNQLWTEGGLLYAPPFR